MHTNEPAPNRRCSDASHSSPRGPARAASWRRRGIATLELAMALPVILLFLVALLTLGSSGAALTSATVKARNEAWRARASAPAADTALTMTKASTTDTLVTRSATEQAVTVSPRISLTAARPEHTVLGGSWDHTDLPMDSPPDWKLYSRLGVSVAGELSDAMTAIEMFSELLGGGEMAQAENFVKDLDLLKDELLAQAGKALDGALAAVKAALTNLEGILDNLNPLELLKKLDIEKQISKVKKKIEAIEKAADAL